MSAPIPTGGARPADGDADLHRLPRTVEARAYRLTLDPDLGAGTFSGSAEVDLVVHEPVREIVCNAADLTVHDATLERAGAVSVPRISLDEDAERVTFSLDDPVRAGEAVLRCRFDGVLNDMLVGFYRSTYSDDGIERTIATTHMQPADARRAFPCWDEPDRKAVFEVSLVVDDGLFTCANAPVIEDRPTAEGRRLVRFAPTMKMSSYLVAFMAGPLTATSPVDVDGVPVRVVHTPGKERFTAFALEAAAHALRFFADYFGIPYPAEKLDLVALPDFLAGAMENVGCVTFREAYLLVDPATDARTELEATADVVAHEIAHMWFGDLVTMRWWDGSWLNEAFATFMEALCVDAFRPEWQRWVSFGAEREMALTVDGLHCTRSIEFPVATPDDADAMFDTITYRKGASVLRMLEQYLGAETFRDGVRRYLRAHAYGNTDTGDLWAALEEASGHPVGAVMDSWIEQGGHPLVTLEAGTLTQRPFTYGPPPAWAQSAIGGPWQVPVLVRRLDEEEPRRHLLTAAPLDLGLGPSTDDVLVNAGGWGVYRVGYPAAQLGRLARRLGALSPLERHELFADTWAGVLAGHASPGDFFDLAAQLGDDDEPGTWGTVTAALSLCDRVVPPGDRGRVEAATRALLGGRARRLGWDAEPGEEERTPQLRALLWASLGTVGADPGAREEAARRFAAAPAAGGTTPVPADIEPAVLAIVGARARSEDYEAVLGRSRHADSPREEARYRDALATFADEDLALAAFELARTELRNQDAPYLVRELLANRVGGPAVWRRLQAEWYETLDRFPIGTHARVVARLPMLCGDPDLAARVTEFLVAHPVRSGQRTVEQSLERLAVNVAFGAREGARLGTVLEAHAEGAGHAGRTAP
jgi:puromycin-sensitive aminopeptidase